MQYLHTKLPCREPMLRQIEREVQNEPTTKDDVLLYLFIFFENFVSEKDPFLKSWLDVPTTQISIFLLNHT